MTDLIKQIGEIGWENTIFSFFLVICVIVTLVSGYKKLLTALGLRSTKSIQEEEFKNNLKRMQLQIDSLDEKVNQYNEKSIEIKNNLDKKQDGLKTDIQSLTDMLQHFIEEQNKSTIAILRSSLWRLHKEFISQKFVTPDGLKTFIEMGKVYENAGGDDIYHEKLLPEVEELDIHYPDGSIYNPKK